MENSRKTAREGFALGDSLEEKLQMYIRRVREEGGVVSTKIVIAAARGTYATLL